MSSRRIDYCLATVPGGLAIIGSATGRPPSVFGIDFTSGTASPASPALSAKGLQIGERLQLFYGSRL